MMLSRTPFSSLPGKQHGFAKEMYPLKWFASNRKYTGNFQIGGFPGELTEHCLERNTEFRMRK